MMTIDKVSTLLLTLTFVVPGFIMCSVFALFTARRIEAKELLFPRYLAFSLLNLIACLWLIRLLILGHYVDARPFRAALAFFVVNFVSPFFLGIGIAALDQQNVARRVFGWKGLRWLKLAPMHPTPSAWDWVFAKVCAKAPSTGGSWIVVRLRDDAEVMGWFSGGSFASSDPSERDLFLEACYERDSEGRWTVCERSDGILIKGDTIASISFMVDAELPDTSADVLLESSSLPPASGANDATATESQTNTLGEAPLPPCEGDQNAERTTDNRTNCTRSSGTGGRDDREGPSPDLDRQNTQSANGAHAAVNITRTETSTY